jgi:nicotinate-nucleotide--dimethylbenzimidazole phosphoribosyltransferase
MNSAPFALPQVEGVDPALLAQAWSQLDAKTKPPRSLGRLEDVAARYAALHGLRLPDTWRPCIVVMAADHGVASAGISAYPQVVTSQMLHNFANGGAAINALCRAADAELCVVNVGTLGDTPAGVLDRRVRAGSRNLLEENALSQAEVEQALQVGLELARELCARGVNLVGLGEMGIGNTTIAALLTAVFTGHPAAELVGRGTGIDDGALLRKQHVVQRALQLHQPDPKAPLEVLAQLGGLEIVALCGLTLGCAAQRVPVLLDGYITTAAALAAQALQPRVCDYLFASHRGAEPGHQVALKHLGLTPLIELDLRLGEGSGAALCLPLIKAASRIYSEMATFASAGVSTQQT